MCKNPSLHQLVEMVRLDQIAKEHREKEAGIAIQKAALERTNKEAAKNVLLGIQLQLARRSMR